MNRPSDSGSLRQAPLFPLPNIVLFPRAVLPLHIFEERYKTMTADALRGERQVTLALLKPGWEKDYYQKPAVEPVVCIGTILTHEKLPDGKYNFLLQGHTRARIVRESARRGYRVAELEPLAETPVLEIDLADERDRLRSIFDERAFCSLPAGRQFQQILASPLPTADVADLIAFNFLEETELKQSLLAETDIRRRIHRITAALEEMRPSLQWISGQFLKNPSLN